MAAVTTISGPSNEFVDISYIEVSLCSGGVIVGIRSAAREDRRMSILLPPHGAREFARMLADAIWTVDLLSKERKMTPGGAA